MKLVLYFKKLNIGGAERSTVRLLNGLAEKGHEVTLFLGTKGGALESELSPKVKLDYLYVNNGQLQDWDRSLKGLFSVRFMDLLSAAWQLLAGAFRKLSHRLFPRHYDLAITGWHGYSPMVLKRYTRYKAHLQMIRNENVICVNQKAVPGAKVFEENLSVVDKYICVSEQIRKYMIEFCKIPEDRVSTVYNIINIPQGYSESREKPEVYSRASEEEVKIVTVCRLHDGAKGLCRMVDVCENLVSKGCRFKWFVVGDGPHKEMFEAYIKEKNVQDTMILCGFQKNPFPYYQHADLVAVLSYVEGLCGTVNEAKLMQRPLIATRFSAIDEQITHGVNGHIVENSEEAIVLGMELLIQDGKYRESLAINGLPALLTDNDLKLEQFELLYEEIVNEKRKQR